MTVSNGNTELCPVCTGDRCGACDWQGVVRFVDNGPPEAYDLDSVDTPALRYQVRVRTNGGQPLEVVGAWSTVDEAMFQATLELASEDVCYVDVRERDACEPTRVVEYLNGGEVVRILGDAA